MIFFISFYRSALTKLYYSISSANGHLYLENTLEPSESDVVSQIKVSASIDVYDSTSLSAVSVQTVRYLTVSSPVTNQHKEDIQVALQTAWSDQGGKISQWFV